MQPGILVKCTKQLGKDNVVPDYSTLENVLDVNVAYAASTWEVGEIFALWYVNWGHPGAKAEETARSTWPTDVWVWTPGGRVPVDLRYTSWDGK